MHHDEHELGHATRPGGHMLLMLLACMAHHEAEIYRLVVLVLSAFRNRGLPESDAMIHLYTVASMMPTLVVEKAPFDSLAAQQRHALLHELGYDQGS